MFRTAAPQRIEVSGYPDGNLRVDCFENNVHCGRLIIRNKNNVLKPATDSMQWERDAFNVLSQPSAEVNLEMPPEYFEAISQDRRSELQKLKDSIVELNFRNNVVDPAVVYDGQMLDAMDAAAERVMATAKDDAYAERVNATLEKMRSNKIIQL